jgi:hypothetical protein
VKAEQPALKAGPRLVRVTQLEEPLLEGVSTVRAQVKVTWAAAP